jgi:hypothetical protein
LILNDPQCAIVEGASAQFTLVGGVRVTTLINPGRSIDAPRPAHRIAESLLRYHATLYAVHRTEVLQALCEQAIGAPSLLSAELLTCMLAVSRGHVSRVKAFTHARNIAPSHSYTHWHPADALAVEPAGLVQGLAYVRSRVESQLSTASAADLRVIDLAITAYLADYIRPQSARRIARLALNGGSDAELRDLGWREFAANEQRQGAIGRLRSSSLGQWLKQRLRNQGQLRERVIRIARSGLRPVEKLEIALPAGRRATIEFEAAFTRRLSELMLARPEVEVYKLAE